MSIAFSVGVIIVAILWYVFGYIWDYPLRKLRAQNLRTIHLSFILPLAFLLLYIFLPTTASEIMHTSKVIIRIASIVLTGTLSFIYYYLSATKQYRPKTHYDHSSTAKWASRIIRTCLMTCIIALVGTLLEHICDFGWPIAIFISFFIGRYIFVLIRTEASTFLRKTKHAWENTHILPKTQK